MGDGSCCCSPAASAKGCRGLVGVGAAADFTRSGLARLSPAQREALERDRITYRPSRYGDGPDPLTRGMLEEGERSRVLGSGLELTCPFRLFHGLEDPDLPWQMGLDILDGLDAADACLTLIAGGDPTASRGRATWRDHSGGGAIASRSGLIG